MRGLRGTRPRPPQTTNERRRIMTSRLTIHGAARTVTGSCFLIEHEGRRLLVDCGLFQGSKSLRELNYSSLPFVAGAIDGVVVTHAHIDHSGLLPKLGSVLI